jgi:hypothetical protein
VIAKGRRRDGVNHAINQLSVIAKGRRRDGVNHAIKQRVLP